MPDSRKKKRDNQEDEKHTQGQIQVQEEQREQNDEDFKFRALQFARIVFARMVGFTPENHHERTAWYHTKPQLTYDELGPYVHPWQTRERLPGYDENLDNGNEYWIFDVPYIKEPLDIKMQIRGQRNGYRLIVEVIWNEESQVVDKVTGRYWYTWGHYGDGVRGHVAPQFTTGIILGISVNPDYGEEHDCTRHDMEEMIYSQVVVECLLDHEQVVEGKYNGELCRH